LLNICLVPRANLIDLFPLSMPLFQGFPFLLRYY
jgi:hypothetical protein